MPGPVKDDRRQIMNVAAILKPRAAVFHAGYDRWRYSGRKDIWLDNSLDTWSKVMDSASKTGMRVAVENVFDEDPEALSMLIEKMNSPDFGLCFDTGHFNIFSTVPMEHWFESLGKRIVEVHLHDNWGERDDHGHVRFAEVDLARKVKAEVQGRLSQRGLRVTVTDKNLGYELRCADPISFDAEYCRDLGFSAVRFLIGGGSGAMVTIQGGRLVPIPFDELREPETGKTKVRLVDVNSEAFRVARAYMIRLKKEDFEDDHELAKFAATTASACATLMVSCPATRSTRSSKPFTSAAAARVVRQVAARYRISTSARSTAPSTMRLVAATRST